MSSTPRRRWFARVLAVYAAAGAGFAAFAVVRACRARAERDTLIVSGTVPGDVLSPISPMYAVDARVGHRPRRDFEQMLRTRAVDDPEPVDAARGWTRRCNNLSLVRRADVTRLAEDGRVVLVGDSHMMGVVRNEDNCSDLLERRLRDALGADVAVYNVASGFYSLHQHLLRLRSVGESLRPTAFVVVVFCGNDLLDLEDVGRPHLDDALEEQPAHPAPPRETTSARRTALALPSAAEELFWQGLNQAEYFRLRPERLSVVEAKARRCLESLRALARERGVPLILALLPGFDLAFPERVAQLGPAARAAAEAGANLRLHEGLAADARELSIELVDALPAFRSDGRPSLYADDYHLFVDGHRLLADLLFEPLRAAMTASPGR